MSVQDKIKAINKKEKESNADQIDYNNSSIINRSRKKKYIFIIIIKFNII